MEFTMPSPRTPVARVKLDNQDSREQAGASQLSFVFGQQLQQLSSQIASLQAQFTDSKSQQQPQERQQRNSPILETPPYSPAFGFEQPNQRRSDVESNINKPNMRRKSMHLQDPAPQLATGYTQSIIPLNPDTCQVRLNTLNFSSVYNFTESMQHLELNHPHEKIQWGRFLTQGVAQMVKAHAEQNGMVSNPVVVRSNYVFLGNDELLAIILDIVRPRSQAAFITDLKSVVKPITLPNGYVMTSNWSWIYKQILLIIYKFKDALEVLNIDQPHEPSYSPSMKSQSGGGKPGLMEIFFTLIPKGKEIHYSLNADQVKACYNMTDYLVLFQGANEKLYQNSKKSLEDATILRGLQPLTSSGEINKPANAASGAYDTPQPNKTHFNNNTNNNTKPYTNPYNPKRNANLSNLHHNIYDINNYYDSNEDNTMDHFHACDPYDYEDNDLFINDSGLNPMYKTTSEVNFSPGEELYALKTAGDVDKSTLPCFPHLRGSCSTGKGCPYNHDDAVLRKEWSSQIKGLKDSPYKDGKFSSSLYGNNCQVRQPSAIQQRPTGPNVRALAALSSTDESSQSPIKQEYVNHRDLHDGPQDHPNSIRMPTYHSPT